MHIFIIGLNETKDHNAYIHYWVWLRNISKILIKNFVIASFGFFILSSHLNFELSEKNIEKS